VTGADRRRIRRFALGASAQTRDRADRWVLRIPSRM